MKNVLGGERVKGRPLETCARVYEKKEKGWKETEIELLKIILYCRERGRERDSGKNKEIIRNLE